MCNQDSADADSIISKRVCSITEVDPFPGLKDEDTPTPCSLFDEKYFQNGPQKLKTVGELRSFISDLYIDKGDKDWNFKHLPFMFLYLRFSASSHPSSSNMTEENENREETKSNILKIKIASTCQRSASRALRIPEFMAMVFVLELMQRLLNSARDPHLPINESDCALLGPVQKQIGLSSKEEAATGLGTLPFPFESSAFLII